MPVIEGTNLSLTSTSLDVKTKIVLGENNNLVVDELNSRIGIGVAAPATTVGISGEADCSIVQEREATAATAGRHTTLQAGGAKSGGTDLAGGTLTVAGGIATGSGASKVLVQTAGRGSTGTDDSSPVTALEVRGDGTVIAGRQTALLAQNATVGFLMIPAVATGAPSGTPANIPTGQTAITFSAVTGKLYVWDGTSAWKAYSPD